MHSLLKNAGMIPVNQVLMDEADILVFNGGQDIGTSIYNEKPIWPHRIPNNPSPRDTTEIGIFQRFSDPSVLKVGICRGAQLLNCLNGGALWQDVNNHGRDHTMTILETGVTMPITSTHHQMMRPARGAEIIATASESSRKQAQHELLEVVVNSGDDTEVVYYGDTNTLCIQGHPEYVPGSVFADWCLEQMHKYLALGRTEVAA